MKQSFWESVKFLVQLDENTAVMNWGEVGFQQPQDVNAYNRCSTSVLRKSTRVASVPERQNCSKYQGVKNFTYVARKVARRDQN